MFYMSVFPSLQALGSSSPGCLNSYEVSSRQDCSFFFFSVLFSFLFSLLCCQHPSFPLFLPYCFSSYHQEFCSATATPFQPAGQFYNTDMLTYTLIKKIVLNEHLRYFSQVPLKSSFAMSIVQADFNIDRLLPLRRYFFVKHVEQIHYFIDYNSENTKLYKILLS